MPRPSRMQRFTEFLTDYKVIDKGSHVETICHQCDNQTRLSNQTVNRHIAKGQQPACKSIICCPPIPNGNWEHLDTDTDNKRLLIECKDCETQYWHHKIDTNYFVCFCKLKIKKEERKIYNMLQEANHTVLREAHLDKTISTHKCDMKVILENGKEIFLEIDDVNHFTPAASRYKTDREFQEVFRKHRKSDQYLIRVPDTLTYEVIQILIDQLETLEFDPISMYKGKRNEEPHFAVI